MMQLLTKRFKWVVGFLFISGAINAQVNFKEKASEANLNYSCGSAYLGNGVSFFDYDKDGWDDITLCAEAGRPLRFLKNNSGVFVEEFLIVPPLEYNTKQTNWVDFDNDGDYDLFVTSDTNGVRLFENTGAATLQDITAAAGFPLANMYSYGASWGDYDNDGFLDVYISNYDNVNLAIPNFLFRNNGNGTFTDMSSVAGLHTTGHLSFCAAFFDFNNDGHQDIFVANDRYVYPNFMYKNNGDGTFTDVGTSSGAGEAMDAMSATVGDYNNDGWFDLYVTNTSAGNKLLRNNGDETFTDVAVDTGTAFNAVGWGAVFLDTEADKDLDLYVSGYTTIDNSYGIPYAYYQNEGSTTFSEPGITGLEGDETASYSNAIGDYNQDGLIDIVVTNSYNDPLFLWKNESPTSNNWLKVKLEGTSGNSDGIGSIIEIGINGEAQYRYTLCGEGYLSQNTASEYFGIGTANTVDYVKVSWLSGTVDLINDVAANQELTVVEGSQTLSEAELGLKPVSAYPNPVTNQLYLSAQEIIHSMSIYAIDGRLLFVSKPDAVNFEVDMSSFPKGLYIVKVKGNSGSQLIKIVKR